MKKLFIPLVIFHFLTINAYEICVAAIFRNEARFLKEWIDYHILVGVEHFFLYNDQSEDNWEEILQPYVEQGIVEVHTRQGNRCGLKCFQLHSYRTAYNELQGKSTWITFIDLDEYILPMQDKTIQECIKNHYPEDASAIFMTWRNFGTSGIYLEPNESMILNLTHCSDSLHSSNAIGKSIYRSGSIYHLSSSHSAFLNGGEEYYDGSGQLIYRNEKNRLVFHTGRADQWIRINHYRFKDEKYYREEKLPRLLGKVPGLNNDANHPQIQELYMSYFDTQDYSIIEYLEKYHSDRYRSLLGVQREDAKKR